MKRLHRITAGIIGLALLLGCSSQAKIIDSEPETEKIQIIGQVETSAPSTEPTSQNSADVTPQPIVTAAPTAEPTEAPTPVPTETPAPEPTEAPTPTPEPTATPEPDRTRSEEFCDVAESYLDYPYARGGTNPDSGFDPGGFVYYCLNEVGVKVRHKTSKGYSENEDWQRVESMDDLEPGDLCFFMTPGNESVNCVCIYLGSKQMIYPSSGEGKVIITKITSNYWTEAFVFARRVF